MEIREFLTKYLLLKDEELIQNILECADVKEYPQGQVLVYAGDPNFYLRFLMSGLVGGYCAIDGSEYCECLAGKAGMSIIDIFPPGTTSRITIKAIEDSTLLRIPVTNIKTLMKFHDCQNMKDRLMAESTLFHIQLQRIVSLNSAEEKITQFAIAFPELSGRVPDQELASILGISERTLFRARKKLREKD